MFLLYINIDHLKLLKRDESFNLTQIEDHLLKIIEGWGGEVSSYSKLISIHPDSFNHSKKWILQCIKDLQNYLLSNLNLVGFSIILDRGEGNLGEGIHDRVKYLQNRVTKVNSLWFTGESVKVFSWDGLDSSRELNHISRPIEIKREEVNKLSYSDLDRVGGNRYRYKKPIDNFTSKEIAQWGIEMGVKKVLLFDCPNENELPFRFVQYIISNRSSFNPIDELSDDERERWGVYFDLYSSLVSGDEASWILDSPVDHLNNLIDLWLESYCLRYPVILIANSPVSSLPGINRENLITVFSTVKNDNSFSHVSFVDGLDRESVKLLYCALITSGSININDLRNILETFGYRGIYITELLENFRLKGVFWGDIILYGDNKRITQYIEDKYKLDVKRWSHELINALLINKKGYLINKLVIEISKKDLPDDIVHKYIDTTIDMGFRIGNFKNFSRDMADYAERRSKRFFDSVVIGSHVSGSKELDYLNVSDALAKNSLDSVVTLSKTLYMYYQHKEDSYNESKSKILFSLSLIATGRIDEAIDYLELNANYSISAKDHSSYIRSTCYLMVAMVIKGNLTGAIRVYNNSKVYPWFALKTRWYLYSNFIAARAYGELGDYEDAIELLEQSLEIARDRKYFDVIRVLNNWMGLFTAYSGKLQEGVDIIYRDPLNYESNYFLSVIEYIRGNIKSAYEFIDRSQRDLIEPTLFDDRVDWMDGYSFIEEMYKVDRSTPIVVDEVKNFYDYISTLNGIDRVDALHKSCNLIPNDSTLVKDMKNLYYLYKVLKEDSSLSNSSKEKIIDKSVRLIQQRGNNIDSHNRKVSYYNNYWNKIIMENKR